MDGKLQVVNNNTNSFVIKLNSLDTANKKNSRTIVNLQEPIYLQTEQDKKVDADRQQDGTKQRENPTNKALHNINKENINACTNIKGRKEPEEDDKEISVQNSKSDDPRTNQPKSN